MSASTPCAKMPEHFSTIPPDERFFRKNLRKNPPRLVHFATNFGGASVDIPDGTGPESGRFVRRGKPLRPGGWEGLGSSGGGGRNRPEQSRRKGEEGGIMGVGKRARWSVFLSGRTLQPRRSGARCPVRKVRAPEKPGFFLSTRPTGSSERRTQWGGSPGLQGCRSTRDSDNTRSVRGTTSPTSFP